MKKITRSLPCTPVVDGVPTYLDFTGFDVGPLFVHPWFNDRHWHARESVRRHEWTVSHIATGFSVHKFVPTKARAIALAKALRDLDCWDFDRAEDARELPQSVLAEINRLREAA